MKPSATPQRTRMEYKRQRIPGNKELGGEPSEKRGCVARAVAG